MHRIVFSEESVEKIEHFSAGFDSVWREIFEHRQSLHLLFYLLRGNIECVLWNTSKILLNRLKEDYGSLLIMKAF